MLDFSKEVVGEMIKGAFNLYNKSTNLMQNFSVEFSKELGQIKPKLETIFESFSDIVAIEPSDVELINNIKETVSKEHGLLSVSVSSDYQLDHLKKTIDLIDFKLRDLEKLALWIDDNKPTKSSDEELEPYLERAKKLLSDLEEGSLELTLALKRYRNVVMVSIETLEILLVDHSKK